MICDAFSVLGNHNVSVEKHEVSTTLNVHSTCVCNDVIIMSLLATRSG